MPNAPAPLLPAIGTPATYEIGSDRYAGEVVAWFNNGRELWVRFRAIGLKKFTYRPVDSSRTGRPCYRGKGSSVGFLTVGEAIDYRDPSF